CARPNLDWLASDYW
nr:immunoglobulin heavy chain junction region [Macaca mulatta]MOV90269.1 immunoglobulin heavy chain junction region [Macaca mulatta]